MSELTLADLPESPVEGLEPMLNTKQLAKWMGWSPWYVNQQARKEHDPLPLHGTTRNRRAKPSEVLAWLKRQDDAADIPS